MMAFKLMMLLMLIMGKIMLKIRNYDEVMIFTRFILRDFFIFGIVRFLGILLLLS
jgi:hypothetical protein